MQAEIEAKIEQTRRSDRIAIALPVEVFGTEVTGQDFFESTETHLLSRHGAAIVLKSRLAPLQQVTIRNLGNGKEATAQVIGPMGGRAEGSVYGFSLLNPQVNLWNINFPPISEAEKAVFRVLLECNACGQRELAYLDKLESEVFEANRKLTRPCCRCAEPTVWHLAAHDFAADRDAVLEKREPAAAKPKNGASSSRNNRKHPRVRMKTTACIFQPGYGSEEIVRVEDISRGGLSFRTTNLYYLGTIIEVAAPFTAGAANVFIPARVVRVENRLDSKPRLYAVAYLKN